MEASPRDRDQSLFNRTIWRTTAILTTTLAGAGMTHGLFEALQGNRSTPGIFIDSIGPDHIRWLHGTDPALTLVPNFLATGIAAIAVSVLLVVWVFTGLRRLRGPAVLLGLFILLTLVGGGIGHIPFFLAIWAYSTRIQRPASNAGKGGFLVWRRLLNRAWAGSLALSALLFLAVLALSVFGAPWLLADPEALLQLIWWLLLASFVGLNAAYLGALARDAAGTAERGGIGSVPRV